MRRLGLWTGVLAAAAASACSHPAVKTGATAANEKAHAAASAAGNNAGGRPDGDVDLKQLWILSRTSVIAPAEASNARRRPDSDVDIKQLWIIPQHLPETSPRNP